MKTLATSFADPADVARFNAAKAKGMSDKQAFKFGDNGIGCYGDVTAQTRVPMCALPLEDIREKWNGIRTGKHRGVLVTVKGKSVRCLLADVMPARANITNGAGIDLNPAAAAALGLKPPFKVPAEWQWSEQ